VTQIHDPTDEVYIPSKLWAIRHHTISTHPPFVLSLSAPRNAVSHFNQPSLLGLWPADFSMVLALSKRVVLFARALKSRELYLHQLQRQLTSSQDWASHRHNCYPPVNSPATYSVNMIATPPPAEPELITVTALYFDPEQGKPIILSLFSLMNDTLPQTGQK
jgi:hypothetical protein